MVPFVQEYSGGLTVSIVGHALIVLLFSFNLISMPFKKVPPVQLAIEATVIDMGAVRRKQEEDKRRQLELERQKQTVEAERRKKAEALQRDQEKERLAEQKRRQEVDRKRAAEQKSKAEAREKAERQRVAEQKRKAEEARVAEQKRKEVARKEAERQRQQEIQRQLQSEITAEEERFAAISSGKLQQYIAAISARVTRNWHKPASAKPGIDCEVSVTQIPGGEIINVRVGRCNGDAAVVRSIEAAVYRASPLPPPPDPSLFERNLRFTFKPEE